MGEMGGFSTLNLDFALLDFLINDGIRSDGLVVG